MANTAKIGFEFLYSGGTVRLQSPPGSTKYDVRDVLQSVAIENGVRRYLVTGISHSESPPAYKAGDAIVYCAKQSRNTNAESYLTVTGAGGGPMQWICTGPARLDH